MTNNTECEFDQRANDRCRSLWRCDDCDTSAEARFSDICEAGPPLCAECGEDMELVNVLVDPVNHGLFLALFHGRHHPEEQLDDWGFDGPMFEITHFHSAYGETMNFTAADGEEHDLHFVEGMVHYDGKYYGDWAIHLDDPSDPSIKLRLQPFDSEKSDPTPCP